MYITSFEEMQSEETTYHLMVIAFLISLEKVAFEFISNDRDIEIHSKIKYTF